MLLFLSGMVLLTISWNAQQPPEFTLYYLNQIFPPPIFQCILYDTDSLFIKRNSSDYIPSKFWKCRKYVGNCFAELKKLKSLKKNLSKIGDIIKILLFVTILIYGTCVKWTNYIILVQHSKIVGISKIYNKQKPVSILT